MESTNTPYSKRASILGELWTDYKDDDMFSDFIEFNDLGLPLAFALSEGVIESTPLVEQNINETWDLLMSGLELMDTGFDNLDEIMTLVN